MITLILFVLIGGSSFTMLRYGIGAEGEALAYAPFGIYNSSAIMFSPCELSFLEKEEVYIGYRRWLFSTNEGYIFYNKTTKRYVIATGIISSITKAEKWSSENILEGNIYPQDWIVNSGIGFLLDKKTSIGAGGKIIYENLIDAWGIGFVMDLSVGRKIKDWFYTGLNVKNIGPGIYYWGKEVYSVPLIIQTGFLTKTKLFNIPFYLEFVSDEGVSVGGGIKFNYNNNLWIGTGARGSITLKDFCPLHFGFGITFKDYKINYSLVPFGIRGVTHRIDIGKIIGTREKSANLVLKILDKTRKIPVNAKVRFEGVVNEERFFRRSPLRLGWLDTGKLYINVEASGYHSIEDSIFLKPGDNFKIVLLEREKHGTIKGTVIEKKSKKPVKAVIKYEGETKGKIENNSTGVFIIKNLPYGTYFLNVTPLDKKYIPQTKLVKLNNPQKIMVFEMEKEKSPFSSKVFMTIHINFEFGKAEILPAFYPILDSIGRFLIKHPSLVVEIAGHTDNVPVVHSPYKNNMELSKARAEAVKNYLIKKFKISAERLIAKGYGETQPIAPNDTEEGRAMNRRIEFRIIQGW